MNKIFFISFRWNDQRLEKHSSDKMMGLAFKRLGWGVHYFDYREEVKLNRKQVVESKLIKNILDEKPSIVFINKAESINPNIIKTIKKSKDFNGIFVFWNMDARRYIPKNIIDWGKVCDWIFDCKGGSRLKELYSKTKTPSSFLFAPYENDYIQRIHVSEKMYNLTWYGQLYKPTNDFDSIRRYIIPNIRDILDDYGACFDRTFIRGEDYYKKLGHSRLSISIPAVNLPHYFSNRHSHIMGSGSVVLSYKFDGIFDIFEDGINIITFKDEKELRQKCKYYLNNIDELEFVTKNTIDFSEKFMLSDVVVKEILGVLSTGESSYNFDSIFNPNSIILIGKNNA